jgi:hypothetical protein
MIFFLLLIKEVLTDNNELLEEATKAICDLDEQGGLWLPETEEELDFLVNEVFSRLSVA